MPAAVRGTAYVPLIFLGQLRKGVPNVRVKSVYCLFRMHNEIVGWMLSESIQVLSCFPGVQNFLRVFDQLLPFKAELADFIGRALPRCDCFKL